MIDITSFVEYAKGATGTIYVANETMGGGLIKIANISKESKVEKEKAILKLFEAKHISHVPKLVYESSFNDLYGVLHMTKVEGSKLSDVSCALTDIERGQVAKNLVAAIRSMARVKFMNFGYFDDSLATSGPICSDDYYVSRMYKKATEAEEYKLFDWMPNDVRQAFFLKFRENAKMLKNLNCCISHNDLHFDNILVDFGQEAKIALLDFDNAVAGSSELDFASCKYYNQRLEAAYDFDRYLTETEIMASEILVPYVALSGLIWEFETGGNISSHMEYFKKLHSLNP